MLKKIQTGISTAHAASDNFAAAMNHVKLNTAQSFLATLLTPASSPESLLWLTQKTDKLSHEFSEKEFYLSFSLLPRYFTKEKLNPGSEQLQESGHLRTGFNPADFTAVQTARIILSLSIPQENAERFLKILDTLFSTAEVNELAALYSALPLLPHPELLKARAAEGIRSSMTIVFDAVALSNPYPADYLDEDAWNQMVLKAIFTGRPLDKIYGVDWRANKNLARMLSDYAHERWAAGRSVTPELWRPVGPFLDAHLLKDIERLLERGNELERQAAALAIKSATDLKTRELLFSHPQLKADAENNAFNWHTLSAKWNSTN